MIAQTILHLCANESNEKYIKMLVGLITAIILIFPIVEQIGSGTLKDFETYRAEYEQIFWGDAPDYEEIRESTWENWINENISVEY